MIYSHVTYDVIIIIIIVRTNILTDNTGASVVVCSCIKVISFISRTQATTTFAFHMSLFSWSPQVMPSATASQEQEPYEQCG